MAATGLVAPRMDRQHGEFRIDGLGPLGTGFKQHLADLRATGAPPPQTCTRSTQPSYDLLLGSLAQLRGDELVQADRARPS
jgi:hypothetical protein